MDLLLGDVALGGEVGEVSAGDPVGELLEGLLQPLADVEAFEESAEGPRNVDRLLAALALALRRTVS